VQTDDDQSGMAAHAHSHPHLHRTRPLPLGRIAILVLCVGLAVAAHAAGFRASSVAPVQNAAAAVAAAPEVYPAQLQLNGAAPDERGKAFGVLRGGPGNDAITSGPGAGPQLVLAGAGDDTINTANGVRDVVDCGAGFDSVSADRFDVLRNCERITRVER